MCLGICFCFCTSLINCDAFMLQQRNYCKLRICIIIKGNSMNNLSTIFIDQRSEMTPEITRKNKMIYDKICYLLQVLKNNTFNLNTNFSCISWYSRYILKLFFRIKKNCNYWRDFRNYVILNESKCDNNKYCTEWYSECKSYFFISHKILFCTPI